MEDSSEDEPILPKRAKPAPQTPSKQAANPLWNLSYNGTPSKSPATSATKSPPKTPAKSATKSPSKSATKSPSKSATKSASKSQDSTQDDMQDDAQEGGEKKVLLNAGEHFHDHTEWMLHPRDRYGHDRNSPDFDPTSIQIPSLFLKKCTNAMKQWWAIKETALDCVLLMKVGKFYETYHMDADVMVKELDLIYMKGETAHAGFPEAAYSKFSNMLVNKGYRVARIEQTETPQQMRERNRSGGQKVLDEERSEA